MMSSLPWIAEDYGSYLDSRDRLAASILQKLADAERYRWNGVVPPPIWYFRHYEWERFNFDWDVAANPSAQTP